MFQVHDGTNLGYFHKGTHTFPNEVYYDTISQVFQEMKMVLFLCFMEEKKTLPYSKKHLSEVDIKQHPSMKIPSIPVSTVSTLSHEKPILMGRQNSVHIDPLAVQACFRCRALMSDTWHNENSKISQTQEEYIYIYSDQFTHFFGFFGKMKFSTKETWTTRKTSKKYDGQIFIDWFGML